MSDDKRKSNRATVNLMVGETTGGTYHIPLAANISESGLLVESPSGLDRPDSHDRVVELMLPGCPEIIWARCRLVRSERKGFFSSHALQFVDISAVHKKLVRLYVQRCVGIA